MPNLLTLAITESKPNLEYKVLAMDTNAISL